MPYKPDGYTSAAPYLLVKDARATLQFLKDVFGAEELRVIPGPPEQGGIMHAEARIDDTVIMMGEMPDGPPAHIHVYVPDVATTVRRAVAIEAEVVQEPMQKDDHDLRGGVRDADGTTWWIATQQDT